MTTDLDVVKDAIHESILDVIREDDLDSSRLESEVLDLIDSEFPLLTKQEKCLVSNNIFNDVTGFGFLEELLALENVNEIMINSTSTGYLDQEGEIVPFELDTNKEELVRLIQKIASQIGTRCDMSSPILDAWLPDGSRVHGVMPPIAVDGPYLTIRRFADRKCDLTSFSTDLDHLELINQLVQTKKNIVVAGATSSGKTTFLNCLLNEIDPNERIVSIEETAELNSDHPHFVRLISRSENSEGAGKVSLGDLVKASLRMRPDRIIVGEVRSFEAFDLVQALNTGHEGSLCTVHANGPAEVIHRITSLAMLAHKGLDHNAIKEQVCFGVNAIIFVKRNQSGERNIESISLVEHESGRALVRNLFSGAKTYV